MSREVAPKDRAGFTEHASPEAVAAYLVTAKREQRRQTRYIAWLEELLERRTAERDAGDWPPGPEQPPGSP